ncbi:hypothetical protein [Anaerosporobacter faecicola]|uniref:hypothetical protein n=1 Tax=Anaerosporobacter faecicola TaxID=2718714 RepID=UPI00143A3AEA|nr:hypothetical protein [Anaerosporobacter faecicola]
MVNEYGGYLPIELMNNSEYYIGKNVKRFNCARSAILYVLINYDYNCIYLPIYMCESVRDSIQKYNIEIRYYNIDENFEPLINEIPSNAIILIANYYGIRESSEKFLRKYKNVIFDNTQAFFEKPIEGAYNIYSCRKFFGVCDGAYLICNNLIEKSLPEYCPIYGEYLFKAINEGTNSAYSISLQNEEQITKSNICTMSKFSQKVLKAIDYEEIKKKRIKNFMFLMNRLDNINCLNIGNIEDKVPMVYPLLLEKDIRHKLISKKIYVAQWWKYILEKEIGNRFERKLSKYLLPLPIDQRYDIGDMEAIIKIILNEI